MLIGYVRISKADGSQSPNLQYDALRAAGVEPGMIYEDRTSGARGDRPGLENCLRALRGGDVLVVWKLDRLGRNLAHLVSIVKALSESGVGLKVLTGQGAQIDTTTASGRLVFGIFAALAEFERELIRERTIVCGRPRWCKLDFRHHVACGQGTVACPASRCSIHSPLVPLVFADRIQIASAGSKPCARYWFFRPRLQ